MPNELDPYRLQYDEQGRPYYQFPGQPRNYVSPVAMGQQKPEDTTSIFHKAPQWNNDQGTWETPFDWGNLLNIGVAGGLGAGALSAAGAFGGGAGAGAGAMYGPPESLAAGAGGAGAAAGAGGVGASLLKNLTSIKGIASLAGLIPLLMSAKGGGGDAGAGGAGGFAQMPQLNSLMDMSVNRAQRTDPLHQAVTQLAMSRLPTNVQR